MCAGSPLGLGPFKVVGMGGGGPKVISILCTVCSIGRNFSPGCVDICFRPGFELGGCLLPLVGGNTGGAVGVDSRATLSNRIRVPLSCARRRGVTSCFRSLSSLVRAASGGLTSLGQVGTTDLRSVFPRRKRAMPGMEFGKFRKR